ncbi:MAG: DUF418 domain-containing protein [Actinomycetota bacterium]|nr:DUF418 domain-containing protein [Actinomycetota bacterium]
MEKSGGIAPVRGSERVVALDVLRGMGIIGILFVNIGLFSGSQQILPVAPPEASPIYDRIVEFVISAFAEGKFISTLAFLFGLGFAWQGMRAEERGESSGKLLLKRVSILALFGLVHAVLIWSGDILLAYGLMGFVLILFRRRRPRTLLIWAGVSIGLPLLFLVLSIASFALFLAFGDPDQIAQSQAGTFPFAESLAESAREAYNSGSYPEMVIQRVRELAVLAIGVFFIGPFVFAMMLTGAAVARAGWMRNLESHRAGIKRAAKIGLSVGLPLNIAYGVSLVLDPASTGLAGLIGLFCWLLGAPLLAIGYMASMSLFVLRRPGSAVASRLSAVGRLALSNYLTQSIVMTGIFYGLAIYGELGITASLAIALVLLAAQIAASPVYLRRFSSGPVEWLWRRLTYGGKSAKTSA